MRNAFIHTRDLIRQSGLTLILLVIITGCTVPQTHAGAENRLFSPAVHPSGKIDEAMRSRIVRHRFVNVDFRLLAPSQGPLKNSTATGAVVILNLFEDAVFPAVLDRRESRSAGSFTWFGHIDGVQNGQVTLVIENGVMSGNIGLDRGLYQVRYAGEGTHVIYQIDPDAFPQDSKPMSPGGRR